MEHFSAFGGSFSFPIEGGQTVVTVPVESGLGRGEQTWHVVQEDGFVVRKLTMMLNRGKAAGRVCMMLPRANLVLRGTMVDDQPVGDWTSDCPKDMDSEDRPLSTHHAVVTFRSTEFRGKHFRYCAVKLYDGKCPLDCVCNAIYCGMSVSRESLSDTCLCPLCRTPYFHDDGSCCVDDVSSCKMFSCSIYLLPSEMGGCSVMTHPLFWQVKYENDAGFIIPELLNAELLLSVSLPHKDSGGHPLYKMKPVFSRKCLVCSFISNV
jgi:hypothetical protein